MLSSGSLGVAMRKRWLANLGVSILSIIFGTGVALADTAPADQSDSGQTAQTSEQSSTSVTSSDSVTVQTTSDSSQTVGQTAAPADDPAQPGPVATESAIVTPVANPLG